MDCSSVEQRLSDYLESALPADEKNVLREHMKSCENCSALLNEMRSLLTACSHYPALEMDVDVLEKILLRTSGRPRTLTLREQLQWLLRSMMTPKFAAGAGLAALFLALSLNFITPRLSGAFSSLSAMGVLDWMDRGAQFAYGEGLKAFDKKNQWMAEFQFFRNVSAQKMRLLMERFQIPVEEGRKKQTDPIRDKKESPNGKYSSVFSWQACLIPKNFTGRS
jgi:hypothetical protein